MKISFTQEEVEEIVLAHVQRAYGATVNRCKLSTYSYGADYATVTYAEPEVVVEPAPPAEAVEA